MSMYPNILTPPMDSPEFLISSPVSEGSSRSPMSYSQLSNISRVPSPEFSNDNYEAILNILEDPVEKFRFRYKSEMAGTHGSLNGRKSDRSRKQTFPCVRLENYNQPAIVRCSLYQIGRQEPHAHRLVKRLGPDEIDDPHDLDVGPEIGFTANFINMGIIHTAKKFIVSELSRKYASLKNDAIVRSEGQIRPLTKQEEDKIKKKAESESNHINLNQVCLRFEAFKREGNALIPICLPVYSGTINNLKSALTGDLKIVRMDHCTSTCRGGREIFILVEKVTKKNIRVRFFELDDEDNEIWSDYGKFSDLDVHHQYAIVFKTPPYKIVNIDKQVKVFIELLRPSDNAKSEAKDFTYTPCDIIQTRKRARSCYSSSNSSNFSSKELPAILPHLECVNSKELQEALKNDVDSEEFNQLWQQLQTSPNGIDNMYDTFTMDAAELRFGKESRPSINSNEDNTIRRVENEIVNFMHSLKTSSENPKEERIQFMLESILDQDKFKFDNKNNVLHLLILRNNNPQFLISLLKLLKRYQLSTITNIRNKLGQTALHLAVQCKNRLIVELLCEAQADLTIQDLNGNTPLHFAVMRDVPENVMKILFNYGKIQSFINLMNNEGNTALHLAVKTNNLLATKLLCINNANIDLGTNTNGYTPLHMAVADSHIDIVKFLLQYNCDTTLKDFNDSCAVKLAKVLVDTSKPTTREIYELLEEHMTNQGTFEEVLIKEEDQPEDVSDMEVDVEIIKSEITLTSGDALLTKYQRMTHLPDKCVQEVADILNASGSWIILAERLEYGHLLRSNLFHVDANPAKSFVDFLMANGENLLRIRQTLDAIGESTVVDIMDSCVKLELENNT